MNLLNIPNVGENQELPKRYKLCTNICDTQNINIDIKKVKILYKKQRQSQ